MEAGNISIIRTQQPEYLEVLKLRHEVLRAPLGLNLYQEDLSWELDAQIFIYKMDKMVIACLMALPIDVKTIKFRQMAVAAAHREKGIGKKLMLFAEEYAQKKGFNHITFHARLSAVPFYEKLGYFTTSATFEEIGIPHQVMAKIF
ncbi:MAG TPA: GNAT family N-acetyltransferase [Edaphocola sp.]|nr:GNAT family N-acetyltransferase [Edaphocola sp.]